MAQPASPHRIVTPEAVALEIDPAGAGSRMVAVLLDHLIQALVLIPLTAFVFASASPGSGSIVAFVSISFVLLWGYFPLFEGLWRGQTPGKRAQRLRVVLADGQPVTWTAVLIRNLVRLVDFLPGMYAIGTITMVLSRRAQRVGDLAAGTIVVREPAVEAPAPLLLPEERGPVAAATPSGIDVSRMTDREYGLIRAFLARRDTLDQGARFELAEQVAAAVRPRVDGRFPPSNAERFLELVARAYRDRFGPAT